MKVAGSLGQILVIFITLACGLSFAEVTVKPASGKIILESKSCEEIESLAKEFVNPVCAKKISGGWFSSVCQYDFSSCVPDVVRELHGVKALVNGLNSWNMSLFATGVVPVLRYTSPDEFTFYLKSPLCRPLKSGEAIEPKDIGAIRDANGDEVHAFSTVSESLVFSKQSSRTLNHYLLETKSQELSQYPLSSTENKLEYFRCESLEHYLSRDLKVESKFQQTLKKAHQELTSVEKVLAHVLPVKISISDADSQDLKQRIEKLIRTYRSLAREMSQKSKIAESADFAFMREAIKQRLLGILGHLRDNAKSVSVSEVQNKQPLIELIEESFSGNETRTETPSAESVKPFTSSKKSKK
jgi:hypothetical protein